jgi:hypothetical protein
VEGRKRSKSLLQIAFALVHYSYSQLDMVGIGKMDFIINDKVLNKKTIDNVNK